MSKEKYTRYSLKQNFMRQVLFRLDYKGILDIKKIVEAFQNKFSEKFKSFETAYHNHVDLELSNINDVSDTLSVPVKEIIKQEIYRFSENTFGNDKLVLDISKYFSTLTIQCENYNTIDEYKSFFNDFTKLIYETESYASVKRFGLRKIGGLVLNTKEEIFDVFETKYFNFDFSEDGFSSNKNNYIDIIEKTEGNSPTINYRRSYEKGKLIGEDNSQTDAYQIILDFDGYFGIDKLEQLELDKNQDLSEIMEITNDCLFEIFKISVTENFLTKYSLEK